MKASRAIAAVLLAAGRSRRFGEENKLLASIEGEKMVARVAEMLLQVRPALRSVIVVTGYQDALVREALEGMELDFVHNPDYESGLASSLRTGLDALPDSIDGALICLGDMPWIRARHIEGLLEAFVPDSICVPMVEGRRGNPVLWASRFFARMRTGEGDVGARRLLTEHGEHIREVSYDDKATLLDVDTPAALHRENGTP